MKTIVTVGRLHGTQKWEVAVGANRPRAEHRAYCKKVRTQRHHPQYAELLMCIPLRRIRNIVPSPAPAPAKESTFVQRVVTAVKAVVNGEPKPEPAPKRKQAKARPSPTFANRMVTTNA
jgi:hypothetical protein